LYLNFKVEYAMEAIGHAGTCLGMLADDGILLAAERRNTNKVGICLKPPVGYKIICYNLKFN